jgi:drug/metabolite transporter (DMT)-like permease
MLALTSGVITSALGYVIWYYAVAKLTVLQASISQLSVPVIALWLGSLWLGESVSIFLILVSAMILGGIALVFLTKPR